MKVRVVLTIEVDPDAYAAEYGIRNVTSADRAVIREDARNHMRELAHGATEDALRPFTYATDVRVVD